MRLARLALPAALLWPVLLPGPAHGTDLSGRWTTEVEACDKVFTTDGNKTSFRQDSDLYGSGFIIEGKQIRTPTGRCTVTKTKEENDVIHMIASCATDIMYQNMQFSVKVLGPDKIQRIFPGIEGMELAYYRCPSGSK